MNPKRKNENANRDPITSEPGSHPLATGGGAIAGGVAGAGIGAAGGPVGAAVGGAAGAIAGAAGGHAAGEKFNPTQSSELGRFIDYTVIDREGDKVGTVDAVWEDHTGQPYYLAVRTGWLGMGKAHVVPAESAEVNEREKKIRLPFDADRMKSAPAFDSQSDLSEDGERRIQEYFGLRSSSRPDTTGPAAATRRPEEGIDVQLKQEQVNVGKRQVEYGGVRLRKIVRTETVNQPVELKREEIVIERNPAANEAVAAGDSKFEDEEIYIPLRREEPLVEKTVRATENIRVGKRTDVDRQEVSETFRKEDVEIERDAAPRPRRS